eukprot:6372646-Pyramimonas_sp.AAC.1
MINLTTYVHQCFLCESEGRVFPEWLVARPTARELRSVIFAGLNRNMPCFVAHILRQRFAHVEGRALC